MRTWYTTKPNMATVRSQISHVVGDSTWEGHAANVFEKSGKVVSYVKNDHLRSEEHTSELQSLMRISYAVFCLKKKKFNQFYTQHKDLTLLFDSLNQNI